MTLNVSKSIFNYNKWPNTCNRTFKICLIKIPNKTKLFNTPDNSQCHPTKPSNTLDNNQCPPTNPTRVQTHKILLTEQGVNTHRRNEISLPPSPPTMIVSNKAAETHPKYILLTIQQFKRMNFHNKIKLIHSNCNNNSQKVMNEESDPTNPLKIMKKSLTITSQALTLISRNDFASNTL